MIIDLKTLIILKKNGENELWEICNKGSDSLKDKDSQTFLFDVIFRNKKNNKYYRVCLSAKNQGSTRVLYYMQCLSLENIKYIFGFDFRKCSKPKEAQGMSGKIIREKPVTMNQLLKQINML